jgi:hypothetical protein
VKFEVLTAVLMKFKNITERDAVLFGEQMPTFRTIAVPLYSELSGGSIMESILKKKAQSAFETTRPMKERHIPEDLKNQHHYC